MWTCGTGIFEAKERVKPMLDDETCYQIIATAIAYSELQDLDVSDLGDLAAFEYADDPNVEFIYLGDIEEADFTPEAGAEGHGTNTEEEMLHTGEF